MPVTICDGLQCCGERNKDRADDTGCKMNRRARIESVGSCFSFSREEGGGGRRERKREDRGKEGGRAWFFGGGAPGGKMARSRLRAVSVADVRDVLHEAAGLSRAAHTMASRQ